MTNYTGNIFPNDFGNIFRRKVLPRTKSHFLYAVIEFELSVGFLKSSQYKNQVKSCFLSH